MAAGESGMQFCPILTRTICYSSFRCLLSHFCKNCTCSIQMLDIFCDKKFEMNMKTFFFWLLREINIGFGNLTWEEFSCFRLSFTLIKLPHTATKCSVAQCRVWAQDVVSLWELFCFIFARYSFTPPSARLGWRALFCGLVTTLPPPCPHKALSQGLASTEVFLKQPL